MSFSDPHNFVCHPLSSPKDTGSSPGKRPILPNWQKLTQTPEDIEKYIETGCNIGIVCGRASGVIVLDFDHELLKEDVFKGIELNTLISGRTAGRGHVYFKYTQKLPASKHHDIGIEVLSDGNNAVIPPSIHASGSAYKWLNPDAPIMEMSDTLIQNLNNLFKTETELKQLIAKCRHCFRDIIKRKPDMHGAEGREYMLAVCTDMKANDATEDHIKMFAKLMYGKDYKEAETLKEWSNIDSSKTWTCDKLRETLPSYVDLTQCDKCEERRTKYKEFKDKKIVVKAPLELPQIPYEQIDSNPITITELLEVFKKHLYIEEDYSITIPLAEVIGNFANIEPDIMGIIGASGSSKTELIRALGELENQYFYPVSSLTGHTFVSGLKENIDLAPCLRGRLLTIKDFTSILSKKKDEVSEIFADLRELTDGHIGKDFGSGVKKHYKNIHTSVLFGCTNAIEKHNSMYSNLGQRIVFFRPISDKKRAMKQAIKNGGAEGAMREELHKITMQFINTVLSNNKERLTMLSHIPENMTLRVEDLVGFLANVRTPIDRDFKGNMATIPEPEYPTRLAKTMCKLIDAHALLYNREPTKQDEYVAYRLTFDNIPVERIRVLKTLIDGNEKTTSEVQQEAKIPNNMAHRVLDDLKALDIIEYFSGGSGKPDIWQLSNETYGQILEILFDLEKHFDVKVATDSERPQGDIRLVGYTDIIKDELHFFKNKNKKEKEREKDSPQSEYHPTVNQDAEPQPQKQNLESCDICKQPLNGSQDLTQGLPGQGKIHTSCKYLPIQIKFIVDVQNFMAIDNKLYPADRPSYKVGDVAKIPAMNACGLIMRRAAERIEGEL